MFGSNHHLTVYAVQEVVVGAPYLANVDGSTGAIFVYKTDTSSQGLMNGKTINQ